MITTNQAREVLQASSIQDEELNCILEDFYKIAECQINNFIISKHNNSKSQAP